MGASIIPAHGMAKARGAEFNKKLVSVIGDSTFMHSGITGLVDIVYNKGNNTVIILDNSITGMTVTRITLQQVTQSVRKKQSKLI